MNPAPIVLFVYNRSWHTQQTVKALQKNELARESELFIYSDAAKNEDSIDKVSKVREYIEKIDGFKKITVIKRDRNWGLADSIIDGVTEIINIYGKTIVLEDDLVTSRNFLKFMNEALMFYKDEEKVWHISGYSQPFKKSEFNEHFFIKPTTCWGWATWHDRWKYFRKDTDFFIKKFDKTSVFDFNIRNSYPYYSHLIMNKDRKFNTWAIFWYASVYFNNGLSLHPLESFVNNIGHDGSGSNCENNSNFQVKLESAYVDNLFPKKIEINKKIVDELEKYYKGLNKSIFIKIIRKLNKIIKGMIK